MKYNKKKILTFIVINFILSVPLYYLSTKTQYANLGLMLVPAFSSILTQFMYNKNIKGFGWTLGKGKYLVISFIIPLLSCLIVYCIAWITKIGEFSLAGLAEVYSSPIILLVLILINFISALGEEIGWRDFLASELLKNYSYIKASLILFIIWFSWHIPVFVFTDFRNPNTPLWYSLTMMSIMMLSWNFITVWIRIKSGSLWTALYSMQVITCLYNKFLM